MPTLPFFGTYGWETYSWPKPGAFYRTNMFPLTLGIGQVTRTSALFTGFLPVAGQWGFLMGRRSGSYTIRPPFRAVAAATPDNLYLGDLRPGTFYYCVPVAFVVEPNPAGLPISNLYIGDEQQFNTVGP